MIKQIQQAESAIKAGDTKTAFEILRHVLAENPDSERAWWVMSGLVPREQRAHCVKQVLRINPQNQFAREALNNLEQATREEGKEQVFQAAPAAPSPSQPAPSAIQPDPAPPQPDPAPSQPDPAQPEPKRGEDYQTWYYTRKSAVHLTILANQGVIRAITEPTLITRVQAAVNQGKLPDSLIKDKKAIPYQRLTRVRQIISSLRVYYNSAAREESIRLELADAETADQVLSALRQKLGPDFILKAEPMRLRSALVISTILLLGSVGITAFFLWGAIEVQSGQAGLTGSSLTRSIISILDLLGPVGVGIIGGFLILLAVGISTWVLFKPPTVTELIRRS